MPLECAFKQRHGRQFCVTDCPASAPCGTFEYVRVERSAGAPAADPRAIDVAVLDMNHGWPNLGHDSLVHAIMDASGEVIGKAVELAKEGRLKGLRVKLGDRTVGEVPLPKGPAGGALGAVLTLLLARVSVELVTEEAAPHEEQEAIAE